MGWGILLLWGALQYHSAAGETKIAAATEAKGAAADATGCATSIQALGHLQSVPEELHSFQYSNVSRSGFPDLGISIRELRSFLRAFDLKLSPTYSESFWTGLHFLFEDQILSRKTKKRVDLSLLDATELTLFATALGTLIEAAMAHKISMRLEDFRSSLGTFRGILDAEELSQIQPTISVFIVAAEKFRKGYDIVQIEKRMDSCEIDILVRNEAKAFEIVEVKSMLKIDSRMRKINVRKINSHNMNQFVRYHDWLNRDFIPIDPETKEPLFIEGVSVVGTIPVDVNVIDAYRQAFPLLGFSVFPIFYPQYRWR